MFSKKLGFALVMVFAIMAMVVHSAPIGGPAHAPQPKPNPQPLPKPKPKLPPHGGNPGQQCLIVRC